MEEEDPDTEWEIVEYPDDISSKESKMSWVLSKGLNLGKKLVVTGLVVSSAPVLVPSLAVFSALGIAFSVPFGFVFATYACTDKIMNKLLSRPSTTPSLPMLERGTVVCTDEDAGAYDKEEEEQKENLVEIGLGGEIEGDIVDLEEDGKLVGKFAGGEVEIVESEGVKDDFVETTIEEKLIGVGEEFGGEIVDFPEEGERKIEGVIEVVEAGVKEDFEETPAGEKSLGIGGESGSEIVDSQEVAEGKMEGKFAAGVIEVVEVEMVRDIEDLEVNPMKNEKNRDESFVSRSEENGEEGTVSLKSEKEIVMGESIGENPVVVTESVVLVEEEEIDVNKVENVEEAIEAVKEDFPQIGIKERFIDAVKEDEAVQELGEVMEECWEEERVNGVGGIVLVEGDDMHVEVETVFVKDNRGLDENGSSEIIVGEIGEEKEPPMKEKMEDEVHKVVVMVEGGEKSHGKSLGVEMPFKKEKGASLENCSDEGVEKIGESLFVLREEIREEKPGTEVDENLIDNGEEEMLAGKTSQPIKDPRDGSMADTLTNRGHVGDVQGVTEDDDEMNISIMGRANGGQIVDTDETSEKPTVEVVSIVDKPKEMKPIEEMGGSSDTTGDQGDAEKVDSQDRVGAINEMDSEELVGSAMEMETKPTIENQDMIVGGTSKDNIHHKTNDNLQPQEKEEYLNSSNSDAQETINGSAYDVYYASNAAQEKSSNEATSEEIEQHIKRASLVELSVMAEVPEIKRPRIATDKPSIEIFDEEKVWEQLNAMRMIVGYRATRFSTCFEELKALYVFTGVEPPASFKDPSDLVEVNDKLHFLMSIVGVK